MKINADWKITTAAVAGLASPDAVNSFVRYLDAALEIAIRLGQLGVAVVTILYIYRRWKAVPKTRRKRK